MANKLTTYNGKILTKGGRLIKLSPKLQPFVMKVKTDNTGTTNDNQFRIPTKPINFDNGAAAWVLPRPVWGTCPGEIE